MLNHHENHSSYQFKIAFRLSLNTRQKTRVLHSKRGRLQNKILCFAGGLFFIPYTNITIKIAKEDKKCQTGAGIIVKIRKPKHRHSSYECRKGIFYRYANQNWSYELCSNPVFVFICTRNHRGIKSAR